MQTDRTSGGPFLVDLANPTDEQRFALQRWATNPSSFRLWVLWNAGYSLSECSRRTGWKTKSVAVYVSQMRRRGWSMPYRNPTINPAGASNSP